MSKNISLLLLILIAAFSFNQTFAQARCKERLIVTIDDNNYFDNGYNDIHIDLGESSTVELPESARAYGVNLDNAEDFSLSTSPSNIIVTALSEGYSTLSVLHPTGSSVDLRFNYVQDFGAVSFGFPPSPTNLFEGGISFDGGVSYGRNNDFLFLLEPSVDKSEQIYLGGVLCPLSSHIGELGDIYVIIAIEDSEIYALNSENKMVFLPANFELPLYRTGVKLQENIEMEFFDGFISESLEKIEFYIGYSVAEGDGTIYTESDASFSFKVN